MATEQFIREAQEPAVYCISKRREFEDRLEHDRSNINLWIKYGKLGNVASARTLFERWMCWMPDHQGWLSYIKFEIRYNETEQARQIFERFVQCHPEVESWIRYAKFEMKNGEVDRARNVHGRAVEKFADGNVVGFPEFEEQCKETERARCTNKRMPKRIPKGPEEDLYKRSVFSENRYGDKKFVLGK